MRDPNPQVHSSRASTDAPAHDTASKAWAPGAAVDAGTGPACFVATGFAGHVELMAFHRHLLADDVRTGAFVRGVERTVRAGDVVADLGTGTGILAFAACRAGAARVYAIEHGAIIHAARQLAQANGFADRIVFCAAHSSQVRLPEAVDVLVSECLGLMGIGGTMIAAVGDLARRALKPGGLVVPREVVVHVAPVEAPDHFDYVQVWRQRRPGGFDASPLQQWADNNLYVGTVRPDALLAPPRELVRVRPATVRALDLRAHVELTCTRGGRLHGLCAWFDVDLADDVALSTGPDQPATIWRQLFLPLPAEVIVAPADRLDVSLAWGPSSTGLPVACSWETVVHRPGAGRIAAFAQSTDRSAGGHSG
jgi:protein arginine N-methyltransferase 1